jgi:hypothetical protein
MNTEEPSTILPFSHLVASRSSPVSVGWNTPSGTQLAHASGRLPTHPSLNGWQPLAGPGAPTSDPRLSNTLQSLHRRAVRGEA